MQQLLQHLFKANNLGDVPRERLEAMVEEYPSFSVARYLLSSKLRAENADHFTEETRKTNLYFTNPFWLQWLLAPPLQEASEWENLVVAEYVGPIGHIESIVDAAEPVIEQRTQSIAEHDIGERVSAEQWSAPPQPETIPELPAVQELVAEHAVLPDAAETVGTEERIAPVPPEEKPGIQMEEQAGPPLVFESYHMVDYFASQGIKLTPDENPSDRLGRQMKSFTEWLKIMKRLPQKETAAVSDTIAENKVQAIAAHSIEGREVVTETMAEVLAKQGMREKAAEMYHKLSLLNPDKSGYFATKIEQLKTY